MSIDMRKRRRQVAWICFEPLLNNEDSLLKAIQILEQGYQVDSVSSMIAYITRICNDYGIQNDVRKSLYSQFHELMASDTGLLIDPISLLQEKEQLKAAPKPVAQPEKPAATMTTQAAPPPPQPAAQEEAPPSTPNLPLPAWMFAYFIEQLLFYVPDKLNFYESLSELAKNKKFSTKKMDMQISQWLSDTKSFAWTESLPEKDLADIIHLIYTVLCDILGPISADESFHKALAKCEQTPQARQFSPSRFL